MEVQVPVVRVILSPMAAYDDSARSESNFTKARPDIAPIGTFRSLRFTVGWPLTAGNIPV